jgi:putative transposase
VDETGHVVDGLLRAHRDLERARAFFEQATRRRGTRLQTGVTDTHPAYRRAVRRHARRATHIRTGLHRARGETTTPIERSHAPVKDRLRARRGLRSIASGQRVIEAVEAVQALRRGDLLQHPRHGPEGKSPGEQARYEAEALIRCAGDLRLARWQHAA